MRFRISLTICFLLITSGLLVVLLPSMFLTPSSSAGEAILPIVSSSSSILFPPSGSVTMPFNFYQSKILIPVWLNKKYLLMMHLDKSWSTTTFTKEAMEMTSLQPGDFVNIPVLGIPGRSFIAGTYMVISHLKIGEMTVANHRAAVLDWDDYPADGIIGYDILHRVVTTVDYDNRQITFTRATTATILQPGASIREQSPFSIIPWEGIPGGKVVCPISLPGDYIRCHLSIKPRIFSQEGKSP